MDIQAALKEVRSLAESDPFNDELWTANGDVRLDALEKLVGSSVSRQNVLDVAPSFSRKNMVLPGDDASPSLAAVDPGAEGAGEPSALERFLDGDYRTPRDFIRFASGLNDEGLADLISLIENNQIEAQKRITELNEFLNESRGYRSLARQIQGDRTPNNTTQDAIRDYLEASKRNRAQKFSTAEEAAKLYRSRDLDPRSQLDRAMARKSGRGGQRPGVKLF